MSEDELRKVVDETIGSEETAQKKKQTKRCGCGIKVAAIVVLILLGVLAGVLPFLYKNHYLDFVFGGEISNNRPTGWQGNDTDSNADHHNDSSYDLDPRLSRSFWGIDYTPNGAQMEYGCSISQEDVVEDLKLLHQLTPRLRLYGLDCGQGYYVMNGMKTLNIDMGVILTIWVDGNATTYERQYNAFWKLLDQFGGDHITGVSVGNEGKKKERGGYLKRRHSCELPRPHFFFFFHCSTV